MKDLAERYENQPIIRGLVQLVPFGIGSAVDAGLTTQLQRIRRDQLTTFFDELSRGEIELTEELVESDEFLHCYFSTVRAVVSTRRREKIILFARLLHLGAFGEQLKDVDEYEELLATLDDLSFREISALVYLDRFTVLADGEASGSEREVELRAQLRSCFNEDLGIAVSDIPAFLARLQRSGLFALSTTGVGDDGVYSITNTAALGLGELSPRYYKLKSIIGPLEDLRASPPMR